MKKFLTALLLVFITSVGHSQQKKTEKAVIKTTIHCNHCKACETCGQLFQSNMLKIKGIKMYELDETNETITVFYNTKKTDLPTIKTAISKLGYDADDVKADPNAYEKLDSCCKA